MAYSTAPNSDKNKSSVDVMDDIITPKVHNGDKNFDPSLIAHMQYQAQTIVRSTSSSADGSLLLNASPGTGS